MNNCKIDGCENKEKASGLCGKHYHQMRKYGGILPRTRFDKNEIVLYDDYAEVVIYNRELKEVARAKIDLEDIEKIKDKKWSLWAHNYVRSGKTILHRFLLDAPPDLQVDHIDHNPLNNCKSNLRLCTCGENQRYKFKQNNNTSGYPGVTWHKEKNKWLVRISLNGKQHNIGYFKNFNDAVIARKKAEEEYHGCFSYSNLLQAVSREVLK